MAGNQIVSEFGMLFSLAVLLILVFSLMSSCISFYKIKFLHESGLAILMGLAVSAICYYGFDLTINFEINHFVYLFLPIIIFAESISIKKSTFFKNIQYSISYGMLGTFVMFIIMSMLNYLVMKYDFIQYSKMPDNGINGQQGSASHLSTPAAMTSSRNLNEQALQSFSVETENKYVKLSFYEILVMSSALSSKDSSAVSNMIEHHCLSDLHSIIFGEGIFNDATTIVLYQVILNYSKQLSEQDLEDLLIITWKFFYGIVIAMISGCFCGLIGSYILKRFRFLTKTPVNEIIVLYASAIFSYSITESFHFPGCFSMIVVAFLIQHYGWYNLSERSKLTADITYQFLGSVIMGIMFLAVGFSFFGTFLPSYSFGLIAINIGFALVSRMLSLTLITLLQWSFSCFKRPYRFNFRQILLLYFSGIIRGVLAFALAISLDKNQTKNSELIKSTISFIVIITTIIFGFITPLIQHLLLRREIQVYKFQHTQDPHNNIRATRKQLKMKQQIIKNEEHQNSQQNGDSGDIKNQKQSFSKRMGALFKRFNYKYVKPFLIYQFNEKLEEYQAQKTLYRENCGISIQNDILEKKQEIINRLKQNTIAEPKSQKYNINQLSESELNELFYKFVIQTFENRSVSIDSPDYSPLKKQQSLQSANKNDINNGNLNSQTQSDSKLPISTTNDKVNLKESLLIFERLQKLQNVDFNNSQEYLKPQQLSQNEDFKYKLPQDISNNQQINIQIQNQNVQESQQQYQQNGNFQNQSIPQIEMKVFSFQKGSLELNNQLCTINETQDSILYGYSSSNSDNNEDKSQQNFNNNQYRK